MRVPVSQGSELIQKELSVAFWKELGFVDAFDCDQFSIVLLFCKENLCKSSFPYFLKKGEVLRIHINMALNQVLIVGINNLKL